MKVRRRHSPKKPSKELPFTIEHMDSLGQGVSKVAKTPVFIAKTLPGESGVAEINRQTKGVAFGKICKLTAEADNRIEPLCEHYDTCPGCHYLHTDYDSEIAYKRNALLKHLSKFDGLNKVLEIYSALSRTAYRNRIQLHYRHQYLGLIDSASDQVVEIPHCQIICPQLRETFNQLYRDKSWAEDHKGRGHCELYLKGDDIHLSWNKSYAEGGFSQVNEEMNTVLKTLVASCVDITVSRETTILDLFSGDGNLSEQLSGKKVLVDSFTGSNKNPTEQACFFLLNLFADDALKTFRPQCAEKQFDVMLVDPPRKGFPELNAWVKAYKPGQLIYVSCNVATMARDLENLSGKFNVEKVALVDLFPGTYHFETLISLRFKNKW